MQQPPLPSISKQPEQPNPLPNTRLNHTLTKKVQGMPRRPAQTLEKVGAEITTNKFRDDIDHITPIEDKKLKVKTAIPVSPFTTHANLKVADVSDTTVHNQPAAQEEVDASRTIDKAEDNINNATLNILLGFKTSR